MAGCPPPPPSSPATGKARSRPTWRRPRIPGPRCRNGRKPAASGCRPTRRCRRRGRRTTRPSSSASPSTAFSQPRAPPARSGRPPLRRPARCCNGCSTGVAEPGASDPPAEPPENPAERRFGFVVVLGAPNAGKSTLVNRLVGAKVSIVSPKVQTTRSRVLGIALHGAAQLVFVDTPGIFQPRRRLDRSMVQAAWQGAADADLVLLLVDAAQKSIDDDSRTILAGLAKAGRTAILGLNKIDLIRPERLL